MGWGGDGSDRPRAPPPRQPRTTSRTGGRALSTRMIARRLVGVPGNTDHCPGRPTERNPVLAPVSVSGPGAIVGTGRPGSGERVRTDFPLPAGHGRFPAGPWTSAFWFTVPGQVRSKSNYRHKGKWCPCWWPGPCWIPGTCPSRSWTRARAPPRCSSPTPRCRPAQRRCTAPAKRRGWGRRSRCCRNRPARGPRWLPGRAAAAGSVRAAGTRPRSLQLTTTAGRRRGRCGINSERGGSPGDPLWCLVRGTLAPRFPAPLASANASSRVAKIGGEWSFCVGAGGLPFRCQRLWADAN